MNNEDLQKIIETYRNIQFMKLTIQIYETINKIDNLLESLETT